MGYSQSKPHGLINNDNESCIKRKRFAYFCANTNMRIFFYTNKAKSAVEMSRSDIQIRKVHCPCKVVTNSKWGNTKRGKDCIFMY